MIFVMVEFRPVCPPRSVHAWTVDEYVYLGDYSSSTSYQQQTSAPSFVSLGEYNIRTVVV